jgi:hypothetical protein
VPLNLCAFAQRFLSPINIIKRSRRWLDRFSNKENRVKNSRNCNRQNCFRLGLALASLWVSSVHAQALSPNSNCPVDLNLGVNVYRVRAVPGTPASFTAFRIRAEGFWSVTPVAHEALLIERSGNIIRATMPINGLGFSVPAAYCREDTIAGLPPGVYELRHFTIDSGNPNATPVLRATEALVVGANTPVPALSALGWSLLVGTLSFVGALLARTREQN